MAKKNRFEIRACEVNHLGRVQRCPVVKTAADIATAVVRRNAYCRRYGVSPKRVGIYDREANGWSQMPYVLYTRGR